MPREFHQPSFEPVERPERTPEEMLETCGNVIAFVMALGPHNEHGFEHIVAALNAARHAKMAAAFVLASPDRAGEASEALRVCGRKGRTMVQAIEFDEAAAVDLTHNAGDFELFNIPFGLIETARVVADSVLDTYEAVVIMDAEQENVTADHLYELCLDVFEEEPEVVSSWIQWLRRPPVLLTRAFLDNLDGADYTRSAAPVEGSLASCDVPVRPVPRIRTFDHVFGEEKLAAPGTTPAAVDAFLDKCTMTALQAVQLARYAQGHPGEELHSPNQAPSLLQATEPEPLNNADALLVKTAGEAIAAGDEVSEEEAAELAWADAFGRRNKRDFPLLNDRAHAGKLAYLDSAATSQRVAAALQAQHDFDVHENANVYRGAYDLSAQATFTLNDARKRLEDFIGAKRRQTVLTANTTAATNLVAQAWGEHNISAADLIVCCQADHHSNMLPFLMLAQRTGARVEYVPFDAMGRIDQQAYAVLLAQGPKLVCLTQVGNVFGIEAPVKEMAAAAHAVGARVLLDAAQSFPHMKIDVADLGVDWVAFSAHKAYGPMGIGALWIAPDAFDEMDPIGGGGGSVSHVGEQSYYLRPLALQYELGTPPVSQAVGWAAAIDYLEGLGMDDVARHGAAMTRYAVRGLQRIEGVNVVGDHTCADGQNGLVSFTVRSVAPAETARFLGRLGVAVRSGGHCALPLHAALGMIGTGRLSIAVHTTRDDIDAALAAVALCRQTYES